MERPQFHIWSGGLGWPGSRGNQSHHSVSSQVIHLEPRSKLVYNNNNNIQLCNTVTSDKADETRQRQHTRRTFLRFLFSLKKRDNTEFSEMYLMCNSPPSYPRLENQTQTHNACHYIGCMTWMLLIDLKSLKTAAVCRYFVDNWWKIRGDWSVYTKH